MWDTITIPTKLIIFTHGWWVEILEVGSYNRGNHDWSHRSVVLTMLGNTIMDYPVVCIQITAIFFVPKMATHVLSTTKCYMYRKGGFYTLQCFSIQGKQYPPGGDDERIVMIVIREFW